MGSYSPTSSHLENEFDLDKSNSMNRDSMSFSEDTLLTLPHSTPKKQGIVCFNSQTEFSSENTESDDEHSENEAGNVSRWRKNHEQTTLKQSLETDKRSAELKLKSFYIKIPKLSYASNITGPVNESKLYCSAEETNYVNSSKYSLFSQKDAKIFNSLFSGFI